MTPTKGWEVQDSGARWVARLAPDVRRLATSAKLGLVACAGTWAFALLDRGAGAVVMAISLSAFVALPVGLWLGLGRSFLSVTLDFDTCTVKVLEKRSWGPITEFEAPLERLRILPPVQQVIRLTWADELDTQIWIGVESEKSVESIMQSLLSRGLNFAQEPTDPTSVSSAVE